MGHTKLKWTPEEEAALRAGVEKHGVGKWKMIMKDPEFAPSLVNRSNIDLKDKWRNLTISNSGRGPRDKTRALRVTPIQSFDPNAPEPAASHSLAVAVVDEVNDRTTSSHEGRNLSYLRDNSIILEAITSLKDPNGSDVDAILHYVKQRQQVPENFRRLLSFRLRKLVLEGKLENVNVLSGSKNENRFKIKDESLGLQLSLLPPENDDGQRPSQTHSSVSISESHSAASRVAEADNKSFVLGEAVKEFEKITELLEDAESTLEVVNYIYGKCAKGETILV